MIREVVLDQSQAPAARAALRKRLISGLGVGGFGLLVVSLGGWWFTAALGVTVAAASPLMALVALLLALLVLSRSGQAHG